MHTHHGIYTHRETQPEPVAKLKFAIVYTPRGQVLSTILEKPIKIEKFIAESRKGRFIECGHFGKMDKETQKAL